MTEDEKDELAQTVKAWRKRNGLGVVEAGEILGLSWRTIQGIEQGRGFGHPKIIKLAMKALTDGEKI